MPDFSIYEFNPQPEPPAITNLNNPSRPQGYHKVTLSNVIVSSYQTGGSHG